MIQMRGLYSWFALISTVLVAFSASSALSASSASGVNAVCIEAIAAGGLTTSDAAQLAQGLAELFEKQGVGSVLGSAKKCIKGGNKGRRVKMRPMHVRAEMILAGARVHLSLSSPSDRAAVRPWVAAESLEAAPGEAFAALIGKFADHYFPDRKAAEPPIVVPAPVASAAIGSPGAADLPQSSGAAASGETTEAVKVQPDRFSGEENLAAVTANTVEPAPEESWYEKWWVWTLVGSAVIGGGVTAWALSRGDDEGPGQLDANFTLGGAQ